MRNVYPPVYKHMGEGTVTLAFGNSSFFVPLPGVGAHSSLSYSLEPG